MLARSFIFARLLVVFTIGFLLAMFNIQCSSSDGNPEDDTNSRSGSALYHQDLDIGGDPNTTFDGAFSYIEPSTGSLLQVFMTKVGEPWYMGQSRYSWIGDLRLEAQLIPGNDISGEPTRILRLISPYFNRFLVDAYEIHGPNNFTNWRKLTKGPVENGNPVSEPYSDREKRFYGTVDISCCYVPGEELDYYDKFLPPLDAHYEESNVIDRWVLGETGVIEPGVFRWSASVGILTEDPTPVVIDTLSPGPYEITYEGRHITVRGDGSANGLRVKVGDISFIADYAPAPVSHFASQWDMRVYGDHQGRPVAQLYFSWDDNISVGTYFSDEKEAGFDGVLYDPDADTCYAFGHKQSLAGIGKITFLQLGYAPEGGIACFVEWSGYARAADLDYCMGPAMGSTPLYGDPIPASVYGLFWTNNCCVWRDEQMEPDPE